MEGEAPKNLDEVRYFMGLAGYYKRFIGTSHTFHILSHNCSEKIRSQMDRRM